MKDFIYSEPVPAGIMLVILALITYFWGRNASRDTGNYLYYKCSIVLLGILFMLGGYVNDAVVKSGMFIGTDRHWESIVGIYTCPIAGIIIILYGLLVSKQYWLDSDEERKQRKDREEERENKENDY